MFNGFRWNIDNEIENKSFVDPKRRLVVARATDWPFCNSVLFLCPNFVENPTYLCEEESNSTVNQMLWSLYEVIHICTAVVDESEMWSSQ